jgi:hypothetical protein
MEEEKKCSGDCGCENKECGVQAATEPVNVAPATPEPTPEEKAKLEKQQTFFKNLRLGAYFLQFIRQDIDKQAKNHFNRTQRRRFERELRGGIFSKELIDVYSTKIDAILNYIDEKLNPKPAEAPVDGVDLYAEAKKLEAEGKLNLDGSVKENS